jgi:hypothetical protein
MLAPTAVVYETMVPLARVLHLSRVNLKGGGHPALFAGRFATGLEWNPLPAKPVN